MRTLFWYIYFGITLLATLPELMKAKKLDAAGETEARDRIAYLRARIWSQNLVKKTGSKVTVTGEHNLPTNGAILFVSNHQSHFDIPLLLGYVKSDKGFVAKIEMLDFKIVNDWMRLIHCIFMDRDDVRQAIRAINEGIEILKQGYNLVLFPEGTRSESGELQEFKPGGMRLAVKSGSAIVPVVIHGAKDIMKKGSLTIHPAEVEIQILPPVELLEGDHKDSIALSQRVHGLIEAALNEKKTSGK
ncbi:lysophospholipid acyltransferase family protein [Acidaminobacter hydrogenoformans]|uniref:1-acyl-sn-glycerol-3-phosphate acyltransferase n=1 Tax=Acidaminobacter hydrogenoformans DSM 2784 TaxID=1120920 RepID=A0A1G5S4Y3_9FIRM|nr:lysophospholipid acyltransferase family protein [Acidaminobacter hydrogenoformans]SCZ81462.1 1-acyl-sn-glycerol-3-phosphate acyltransferase [Acidaminobacter hydrogenoformans DSM 2784]